MKYPFPLGSLARTTKAYGDIPPHTMVRIVNERRQDRARRDVEYVDAQARTKYAVCAVDALGPPFCDCCGRLPCVENRGG